MVNWSFDLAYLTNHSPNDNGLWLGINLNVVKNVVCTLNHRRRGYVCMRTCTSREYIIKYHEQMNGGKVTKHAMVG